MPPAVVAEADPITLDTQVLALTGQFDPFSGRGPAVHAASTGLAHAQFATVPNQSYSTFGFDECPWQVRRAWLDDLGEPLDTACFSEIPAVHANLKP